MKLEAKNKIYNLLQFVKFEICNKSFVNHKTPGNCEKYYTQIKIIKQKIRNKLWT